MPATNITYQRDVPLVAAEVARVYDSSGIRRPTRDLARIAHMLEHSNLVISAWRGNELVGVARSLTDFAWSCYLADLAVSRELQRAGIGRALVERTMQAVGPRCALVLNSAPEAMEYYPRIGLEKLDTAFIRRRSE
jgi:ribosomal protein S18 acetylase RimI-like enzyme